MKTLAELARFYADFMKSKTFDNGIERTICADNAPDELRDAIHAAHGHMLPDDYVYNWFYNALCEFASYTDSDEDGLYEAVYEVQPDVYTANLTAWLASNISRVEWVTEALTETCWENGFDLLAHAQTREIQNVYQNALDLITAQYHAQAEEGAA